MDKETDGVIDEECNNLYICWTVRKILFVGHGLPLIVRRVHQNFAFASQIFQAL